MGSETDVFPIHLGNTNSSTNSAALAEGHKPTYGFNMASTQYILMNEYLRRKEKNAAYSLRAFAKSLEIPPGRLSELMSGKRRATPKIIERISIKLKLHETEVSRWLSEINADRASKKTGKIYAEINPDEIEFLSDATSAHILTLLQLPAFIFSEESISERLCISEHQAAHSIEILKKSGLIKRSKAGAWVATNKSLTTTQDVASAAIRQAHQQFLQLAMASLKNDPVHSRDITSICMPTNPATLAKAKEKILKFRREMAELLMNSDHENTEVYRLNIQLFPVTTPETVDPSEKK